MIHADRPISWRVSTRTPILAWRNALIATSLAGFASAPALAQFSAEHVIEAPSSWTLDVHPADLDGDGATDVIACRYGAPPVWYRNLGGGAFGAPQSFPMPGFGTREGREAATIDFEGDGDVDVLIAGFDYAPEYGVDDQIFHFRNLGDGTFTLWASDDTNADAEGLSVADLEGDGDLDLFWAEWGNSTAYVRRNLGGGSFASKSVLTDQTYAPRDVHVADLDGDGDLDLLYASWNANEVAWFENLSGVGPFGPKQTLNAQADGAVEVNAADLDGDGDVDALSSSTLGFDKEICSYENLGASFAPPKVITNVGFPGGHVIPIDIDGDGDQDLFVNEFYGVSWYPNDGDGEFGARRPIDESSVNVRGIAVGDIDGDGWGDVVLGSNDKVTWFANEVIGPVGSAYCAPAVPNSTGQSGAIAANGSPAVGVDELALRATSLPTNKMGIFIASQTQGFVPNIGGGAGTLCLGAPVKRIQPTLFTGAVGGFELELSLATSLGVAVQPGQTWNFQAWHRDVAGSSNLTHGLQIAFVP